MDLLYQPLYHQFAIQRLEKLGEGTFAVVYKGWCHVTSRVVALKEAKSVLTENCEAGVGSDDEGCVAPTIVREIAALKALQNKKNIISLFDVVNVSTRIVLVLEYCEQNLRTYMEQNGKDGALDPSTVKSFSYQLLCGTACCHQNGIIHRDLKPENLLVDGNGVLKLCDFGSSMNIPYNTLSCKAATLWYRAPDVLLGSSTYGASLDLWSCGCILAEMLLGFPLFCGSSEKEQFLCIIKKLGTPSHEFLQKFGFEEQCIEFEWMNFSKPSIESIVPQGCSLASDLLDRLLQFDPPERITAIDTLFHPYFLNFIQPEDVRELISMEDNN